MRNAKEVIEECKTYGFTFDQLEQQLLYNAAASIKGVEGLVCEIGLRDSGGMSVMMTGCLDNQDIDRCFIAIDPYGGIKYRHQENVYAFTDYTNQMKNRSLKNLYSFCELKDINFNLYCMEDTEFFTRFENGIPTYQKEYKELQNKYALIHFDGPHAVEPIKIEIDFFKYRMSIGGMFVFDDTYVGYYNHDIVESYILESGEYELVGKEEHKASYKRVK
jgi:hypothetical protein